MSLTLTLAVTVAVNLLPAIAAIEPPPTAPKTGELPERRTATSRTVRNDGGTFTTTAFAHAIHYQDATNGWKPIDSTLLATGNAPFAWRNAANSFSTQFRPTTTGDFARIGVDGGEVGISMPDAVAASAVVDGSTITYTRPLPGVDIRYDVLSTSIKESIVVADGTAPSAYRFRLAAPDGTPLRAEPAEGAGWEVWSATADSPLFIIEPAWAAEAGPTGEADPDDDPHVDTSVVSADGAINVVVQVDRQWLYATERQFPVVIDPTITLDAPALDASFKPACGTCTVQTSRGRLSVGSTATDAWRSAVRFDLADLPGSANLTSADLELFFDDSCIKGGCKDPHAVTAHKVTGAWTVGSPSSAFTHDTTALATVTSPTSDFAWLSWSVTQTVKDWLDGVSTNNGILLRKTDETVDTDGLSLPARG